MALGNTMPEYIQLGLLYGYTSIPSTQCESKIEITIYLSKSIERQIYHAKVNHIVQASNASYKWL